MEKNEKFIETAVANCIANALEVKIKEIEESDREKSEFIAKIKEYVAKLADISFKNLTCPRVVIRWDLENRKDYLSISKEFEEVAFSYHYFKAERYSSEGNLEKIDYQDAVNINIILSKIEKIVPVVIFK